MRNVCDVVSTTRWAIFDRHISFFRSSMRCAARSSFQVCTAIFIFCSAARVSLDYLREKIYRRIETSDRRNSRKVRNCKSEVGGEVEQNAKHLGRDKGDWKNGTCSRRRSSRSDRSEGVPCPRLRLQPHPVVQHAYISIYIYIKCFVTCGTHFGSWLYA